ncbi:hypothetical protein IC611_20810 [Proteus mirabilis]
MENIIKVFYRPINLAINPKEAGDKLVVKATPNGISIENPTPYYINLFKITVKNETIKLNKINNMIEPFSSKNYVVSNKTGAVNIHIINDLGGESVYNKNFKRIVLLAMMVYAVNCQSANNGTLNFSANVTRGTCEFSDSNELSKHVSFEQFFTIGDAEDTPIKAPIKGSLGTKQFTYLIDCKEYEPDSEKNHD